MFNEYDVVILMREVNKVPAGCKGAVLLVYDNNEYEVEFVDEQGCTIGVETIKGEDIIEWRRDELPPTSTPT